VETRRPKVFDDDTLLTVRTAYNWPLPEVENDLLTIVYSHAGTCLQGRV
jgi:hypothetical protein